MRKGSDVKRHDPSRGFERPFGATARMQPLAELTFLAAFGLTVRTALGVIGAPTHEFGKEVNAKAPGGGDHSPHTSRKSLSQFSPMMRRIFCSDHPAFCMARVEIWELADSTDPSWVLNGFEMHELTRVSFVVASTNQKTLGPGPE